MKVHTEKRRIRTEDEITDIKKVDIRKYSRVHSEKKTKRKDKQIEMKKELDIRKYSQVHSEKRRLKTEDKKTEIKKARYEEAFTNTLREKKNENRRRKNEKQ